MFAAATGKLQPLSWTALASRLMGFSLLFALRQTSQPRLLITIPYDALRSRDKATVESVSIEYAWKESVSSHGSQRSNPESGIDEKDRLIKLLDAANLAESNRRRKWKAGIQTALQASDSISSLRALTGRSPKILVALRQLSTTSSKMIIATEPPSALFQPKDLEYVRRHHPLPDEKDYPTALAALFRADLAAMAVYQICERAKVSLQNDVSFASRTTGAETTAGGRDIKVCVLKVSIPGLSEMEATGEGFTKQSAKQAAWLLIVSKMHISGALKALLDAVAPLAHLTSVDAATLEHERDAKLDIYNYAAGLGMIPIFRTEVIQHLQQPGTLREASMTRKPLYKVNIKLLELGIDVTETEPDPIAGEIAACVTFKREVEKLHKLPAREQHPSPIAAHGILSTDTARQFCEFYRARQCDVNLELEQQRLENGQNAARVALNGDPLSETVMMRTKKQAESVAYLVAAVTLTNSQPALLDEFIQSTDGKGKAIRTLAPIELKIAYEAHRAMQQALINTRASGLPSERQDLAAESVSRIAERTRSLRRMTLEQTTAVSAQLKSRQQALDRDLDLERQRFRPEEMPIIQYRKQALSMVDSNQYSIVMGATGSGKTTQLPQIIFEDAIHKGKGSSCNIICTQPRRIAASSVARRVAAERNESLRDSVGYHVRFDAQTPRHGYGITYCTTGVLIQRLVHGSDAVLDETSHIIVDEVHERSVDIDYLLIMLRRAVESRRVNALRVPKVILMSATFDAKLFASYLKQDGPSGILESCPILRLPGCAYSVREQYLGSILHELLQGRESEIMKLLLGDKWSEAYLKSETDFSTRNDVSSVTPESDVVLDWKQEHKNKASEEKAIFWKEEREQLVPISLVGAVIAHVCMTTQDGAILVFLPGIGEIFDVKAMLLEQQPFSVDFADENRFRICTLHSSVPQSEQDLIFQPLRTGCRKIILSTNIAETSITVPDVKYVVDTGKVRENRYDPLHRINRLQCVWESRSNLQQRAGRAGRVDDGYYYGLFSKERADSFRAVGSPELLRVDLQETCLSIAAQDSGQPLASFFGQAIEPPPQAAVAAATNNLKQIGALTVDERLTALGRVLSKLPVHPTHGKLIVLGMIFKCLDPMILLAAGMTERSLFLTPIGLSDEANKAREVHAGDSKSDQVGYLKAFEELRDIQKREGMSAMKRHAKEQYLDIAAFRSIQQVSSQILGILEESNLVKKQDHHGMRFGPEELNQNSMSDDLIKGLLVAGLYPNIAAKVRKNSVAYRTANESAILIHPSSVISEVRYKDRNHDAGTLAIYNSLSLGNDGKTVFSRDCTLVGPLAVALFGGELRLIDGDRLEMDGWLTLDVRAGSPKITAKLILEFRKALDRVLYGAFSSLSSLEEGSKTTWANDPAREQFIDCAVEILHTQSVDAGEIVL